MTDQLHSQVPDRMVSVREVFGLDTTLVVPAFEEADEHVAEVDEAYRFGREVTLALLAGFSVRDDLYREGIDRQAVLWAARRMLARPELRKVLVVISDGSPMDSATNRAKRRALP